METEVATLTLVEMRQQVLDVNKANGWFDSERSFGDDIALLHSEVSEMYEAYRDFEFHDATQYERSIGVDALTGTNPVPIENPKPEGFGSECADVLIRLLDESHRRQVEFEAETLADVRPHPDFDPALTCGDHIRRLHVLIARNVDPANCKVEPTLQYLKAWCDHIGIDLQWEYDRKVAFNATRGYRHGGKLV